MSIRYYRRLPSYRSYIYIYCFDNNNMYMMRVIVGSMILHFSNSRSLGVGVASEFIRCGVIPDDCHCFHTPKPTHRLRNDRVLVTRHCAPSRNRFVSRDNRVLRPEWCNYVRQFFGVLSQVSRTWLTSKMIVGSELIHFILKLYIPYDPLENERRKTRARWPFSKR